MMEGVVQEEIMWAALLLLIMPSNPWEEYRKWKTDCYCLRKVKNKYKWFCGK